MTVATAAMAMLEAASVGLLVVSTSVGGVPEIFPEISKNEMEDEPEPDPDPDPDPEKKDKDKRKDEVKVGMILCKPEASHILSAVEEALSYLPRTAIQIEKQHKLVKLAYNWQDIAQRTERVYEFCDGKGEEEQEEREERGERHQEVTVESHSHSIFYERLCKAFACGAFMGPLYCAILIVHLLYYKCLQVIQPSVQVARDLR